MYISLNMFYLMKSISLFQNYRCLKFEVTDWANEGILNEPEQTGIYHVIQVWILHQFYQLLLGRLYQIAALISNLEETRGTPSSPKDVRIAQVSKTQPNSTKQL